jgi:hypothetical protein
MKKEEYKGTYREAVFERLLKALKEGPINRHPKYQEVEFPESIRKVPATTKTRVKGLGALLKKYEELKKELSDTWDAIYSTCTHSEQDLDFDEQGIDNTYGTTRGYQYVISCTACKKRLVSVYKSAWKP